MAPFRWFQAISGNSEQLQAVSGNVGVNSRQFRGGQNPSKNQLNSPKKAEDCTSKGTSLQNRLPMGKGTQTSN